MNNTKLQVLEQARAAVSYKIDGFLTDYVNVIVNQSINQLINHEWIGRNFE